MCVWTDAAALDWPLDDHTYMGVAVWKQLWVVVWYYQYMFALSVLDKKR